MADLAANAVPKYLTDPVEALSHAESQENAILNAADAALAAFLDRVTEATLNGSLSRASTLSWWQSMMAAEITHPAYAAVRDDFMTELRNDGFADDVYSAAEMALSTAHNMGATADETRLIVEALFAHPDLSKGLIASLTDKLDGWLRRRISRELLARIGAMSPNDLANPVHNVFPTDTGKSTLVTSDDWAEDDRPGEINWRARMQRDIRTAYTSIFGRQVQRQLEKYGFTKKRWVSRHDDRVRHTHAVANGQVVGIHANFHVGGESLRYPGDPLGTPGEIINCRCIPVGEGERSTVA